MGFIILGPVASFVLPPLLSAATAALRQQMGKSVKYNKQTCEFIKDGVAIDVSRWLPPDWLTDRIPIDPVSIAKTGKNTPDAYYGNALRRKKTGVEMYKVWVAVCDMLLTKAKTGDIKRSISVTRTNTARLTFGPQIFGIFKVGLPKSVCDSLDVRVKATRKETVAELFMNGKILRICDGRNVYHVDHELCLRVAAGHPIIVEDTPRVLRTVADWVDVLFNAGKVYTGELPGTESVLLIPFKLNLDRHSFIRPLQEGDFVEVNRAPTLGSQNIMVLQVVIVPGFMMLVDLALLETAKGDTDGDEGSVRPIDDTPEGREFVGRRWGHVMSSSGPLTAVVPKQALVCALAIANVSQEARCVLRNIIPSHIPLPEYICKTDMTFSPGSLWYMLCTCLDSHRFSAVLERLYEYAIAAPSLVDLTPSALRMSDHHKREFVEYAATRYEECSRSMDEYAVCAKSLVDGQKAAFSLYMDQCASDGLRVLASVISPGQLYQIGTGLRKPSLGYGHILDFAYALKLSSGLDEGDNVDAAQEAIAADVSVNVKGLNDVRHASASAQRCSQLPIQYDGNTITMQTEEGAQILSVSSTGHIQPILESYACAGVNAEHIFVQEEYSYEQLYKIFVLHSNANRSIQYTRFPLQISNVYLHEPGEATEDEYCYMADDDMATGTDHMRKMLVALCDLYDAMLTPENAHTVPTPLAAIFLLASEPHSRILRLYGTTPDEIIHTLHRVVDVKPRLLKYLPRSTESYDTWRVRILCEPGFESGSIFNEFEADGARHTHALAGNVIAHHITPLDWEPCGGYTFSAVLASLEHFITDTTSIVHGKGLLGPVIASSVATKETQNGLSAWKHGSVSKNIRLSTICLNPDILFNTKKCVQREGIASAAHRMTDALASMYGEIACLHALSLLLVQGNWLQHGGTMGELYINGTCAVNTWDNTSLISRLMVAAIELCPASTIHTISTKT
jgi:hypothetical protein